MEKEEDLQNDIYLTLKNLIDQKSKRDKVKFNACQLAEALNMPRSMITKLTHPDKTKRVINPRIGTLTKIVNFFRMHGFSITLEELISARKNSSDVSNVHLFNQGQRIAVYCLEDGDKKMGSLDCKINSKNQNVFGLQATRNIKPFFNAGSIFITEPNLPIKPGMLVAIKIPNQDNIEIRKYCIIKKEIVLKALDENEIDIILMHNPQLKIIGTVIQIIANTQR